MPTKEQIRQYKTIMKQAGLKWANMNDDSWGPGQAAMYKSFINGLQKTPKTNTQASGPIVTTAPITNPVAGLLMLAGAMASNPQVREGVSSVASSVGDYVSDVWNNTIKPIGTATYTYIVNTLNGEGTMLKKKNKQRKNKNNAQPTPAEPVENPSTTEETTVDPVTETTIASVTPNPEQEPPEENNEQKPDDKKSTKQKVEEKAKEIVKKAETKTKKAIKTSAKVAGKTVVNAPVIAVGADLTGNLLAKGWHAMAGEPGTHYEWDNKASRFVSKAYSLPFKLAYAVYGPKQEKEIDVKDVPQNTETQTTVQVTDSIPTTNPESTRGQKKKSLREAHDENSNK